MSENVEGSKSEPQKTQEEQPTEEKSPFINIKEEKPDLRKKEQPLVDVKVTNPVRYIKSWWKRIIGNEGFELRIKIKPLTTIAVTFIIVTLTLGLGRFNLPFKIPFFEFTENELKVATPTPIPTPTPAGFRETAFVGALRFDEPTDSYFLLTESLEAIKLDVKQNVDLEDLIDSRIFATGNYFERSRTLVIISASDMEVLPDEVEPVPTLTPTPSPTLKPTQTPLPTESPTPSPTPIG